MKGGLRLLLDPVYTTVDMNKCATFYTLKVVAEHWVNQGKNRKVYWISNEDLKGGEIIKDPRFVRVNVYKSSDRYSEIWLPRQELFNVVNGWNGEYGDWDLVLTSRNNGFFWRRITGAAGRAGLERFAALYEPFPFLPFKSTFPSGAKYSMLWRLDTHQTLSSYLMFNKVYVTTQWEIDEIMRASRNVFSASEQLALKKVLAVSYPSYEGTAIDLSYPTKSIAWKNFVESQEVRVVYIQRISETQKRFSMVYSVLRAAYAKLCAEGMKFSFQICTNTTASLPDEAKTDSSFITLDRPPRAEFWDLLKKSHVFVSYSKEEGAAKSLLEAIHCGCIGIVVRRPWSVDMFGKDYPWLVDDIAEGYALLKRIYKNRVLEWEKFVKWYKDFFLPVTVYGKADEQVRFERDSQFWFDGVTERMKIKSEAYAEKDDDLEERENGDGRISIVLAILNGVKPGGVVDLLDFSKIGGITEHSSQRGIDLMRRATYHRRPARWGIGYVLRSLHGWENTDTPWVLKRPKRR